MITFSSLISACEKGKNPEQALEIFVSMEHQRVQPNVITFSSLISAYEKDKNPDRTLEIFASMEHQRVQPNVITFNSLICACEKGKNPSGHGASACAARCDHVQLLDQCMREG